MLALGSQLLPRPAYVAVTSRRLICWRLSLLSRTTRRLAFAVPLADLRITSYRPAAHPSRIRCQLPGGTRVRLDARRTGRTDFTLAAMTLTREGACVVPDPPWPPPVGS